MDDEQRVKRLREFLTAERAVSLFTSDLELQDTEVRRQRYSEAIYDLTKRYQNMPPEAQQYISDKLGLWEETHQNEMADAYRQGQQDAYYKVLCMLDQDWG